MIDYNKIYVYTGSETGYTNGHWYYWNGAAWADGGVYNAVAVQTDTTLSRSGQAADAKTAGDGITDLKNAIDIISLPWKSGALYQATGIEYAIANRSVTPFLPVTPGETIYIERDSSLSGVGVFEFASNTTTASGVNERLSFYSISANKSFYTVGESTHYVRLQCNYPLADVVGKVTVLRLSSPLNAVIERFSPSFVTPSMFADQTKNTDAKMIQAAVNYAFAHKCDVAFDRLYTLGDGEYILLNKYSGHVETDGRYVTRLFGIGGNKNNPQTNENLGAGIVHKYSGNIFTANSAYASESGDFIFENLMFESETGVGCNVFNMNTMMRFTVKGCFFKNVDSVAKNTYIENSARTHYWQDVTFEDCTIIGGKGWAMFADGVYVVNLRGLTIEHRDGGIRFGVYHSAESYPYSRCRNLVISDCCIEGISGSNVRTIDENNYPTNAWAIHIEGPYQVLIQGCYFEGNYKNILFRNGSNDGVFNADVRDCWLSGYFNKERYGTSTNYRDIVNDKYIVTIGGTVGNYLIEKCSTERGGIINAPANSGNIRLMYLENSFDPSAKGVRSYGTYSYDSVIGVWKGSGNFVYDSETITGGNNNEEICKTYADGADVDYVIESIDGVSGLHALDESSVITSAGQWSDVSLGNHVCLPINGGDTVALIGGLTASYFGFLKSNTHYPGSSASFSSVSGYTNRIALSAGTGSGIMTAPYDAKYLYFATVNNVGNDQVPASVTINGIEMTYNIRQKIDVHDASISKNSGLHGIINGTSGLADGGSPCVIRNNDGEWTIPTNGKHIRFPIKSGDVINITGGANATYYAILKSNENPQYGNYATFSTATGFTQRILLSAGANTGEFTAPDDAVYLYIAVQNNAGQSQSPTSLMINGVEMAYNIRQKIDSLAKNAVVAEGQSANKSALDIWGMRSSYDGVYSPVSFSGLSFLSGFTLPVFSDGYKVKHTVDLSQHKNTSSHTTTVTSQSALTTAITNATSGDTIILDSGRYTPITIGKSINLIGKGQVIFADQPPYEFTETATSGTWRTANNSVSTVPTAVLDITRIADGIIIPLTKVVDPTTVTQTKYGWCHVTATNNVYVQLDGTAVDGKNIVLCYNSTKIINCKSSTENAKVYLENITVVGGHTNIWAEDATGYTSQKLIAKNCRCYYAQQGNSIGLRGVNGYFQKCECAYARLDGFNYHINNTSENSGGDNTGTISNGLEVDCIGHDNGISDTGTNYSDNGSTGHDAAKIVRINGVYYNNNGGNVADVTGVTSYNYGCYAFDSTAPNNTNRADFWCRDSSSNMYLYGCRSSGNSQYNLCAANSSTIHVSKCEYTTTTGTIDVLT